MTALYHITDLINLTSVFENGGLLSYNHMKSKNICYKDIAYSGIQDKRSSKGVPCEPKGTLHDYVPFYFSPRSPMLYTINKGNVPNCTSGQNNIIYLISTAESIKAAGLKFVFTDGHAIMELSNFYNDLTFLNHIDWNVMESTYWYDTQQDPDRKRRRQAEFLVYNSFPIKLIHEIVAIDKNLSNKVYLILKEHGVQVPISIRRDWYY
jgi:hypothetical protein